MSSVEDFDLLGLAPRTMQDPYRLYELLLEEAPVYREPRYGVYIISRYDDILEIKRQPHKFSNRQATGPVTMPPRLEDLPEELRASLAKVFAASCAGRDASGRGPPRSHALSRHDQQAAQRAQGPGVGAPHSHHRE
jgi:hypothetical protein